MKPNTKTLLVQIFFLLSATSALKGQSGPTSLYFGNREPGTSHRESETVNYESGTGNREPNYALTYLYLETPVYEYIDYGINSGKLIPKFVLRQPYEIGRDMKFDGQREEESYFDRYWQRFYHPDAANLHLTIGDQINYDQIVENRYQAEGGVHYTSKNLTLANRTGIQQVYKDDAYFAGDLSESDHWLYGRVNEAYANLVYQNFDFFIGRVKRNWGPPGQNSLILSNNPYSYDHILLDYTQNHFKFSLMYARLEDLDGYSIKLPDSVTNSRKYLVGHRLDIRFSDRFQVAFTEMATYGGPGRDFEISFLNPMTFYYGLQRNDKEQMNGFWATDLFYKPVPRMTFYAQLLIDDIVVNNDPGVNDRAQYPDRFAVMFSLRGADFFKKGVNTELTYNRVWNRTYQSKYTWENYHYRGLGLGYPCASCEELKIKLGYWGLFPLFIQQQTIIGRYGSVSLEDSFPLINENFPIEPVKHNLIAILSLTCFLNPSITICASAKYQKQIEHYAIRLGEKGHFIASLGFNWTTGKSIRTGK